MIKFACQNCGRAMQVPDSAAGKTGTCKTCEATVVVPESPNEIITRPANTVSRAIRRPTKTIIVDDEDEIIESRQPAPQPMLFAPQIQQVTHVNVSSQSNAGCLAVTSVLIGCTAAVVSVVPVLGLSAIPLAGLGVFLGVVAILVAATRRESAATPLLGILISCGAVAMSLFVTMATGKAIDESVERTRREQQAAADAMAKEVDKRANDPQKPVPAEQDLGIPNKQDANLGQITAEQVPSNAPNDDPVDNPEEKHGQSAVTPDRSIESIAASKLALAKTMLARNKSAGLRRLNEIINSYPDTEAADEARQIRDKSSK